MNRNESRDGDVLYRKSVIITVVGAVAAFLLGFPTQAAQASFTGPSQGIVNSDSAPFTVTVDNEFNGNFHIDVKGGGLNYRVVLAFDRPNETLNFTIRPTQIGVVTLVANPSSGARLDRTLLYNAIASVDPTPTPTPTVSPTPSTSPTPTVSPTPSTSPTPTVSPTPSPTNTLGGGNGGGATGAGEGNAAGSGSTNSTAGSSGANSETGSSGLSIFRSLPFEFRYDPSQDLTITFELPGGPRVDLATLHIPQGATGGPALLSISAPSPLTKYRDGELDLEITLRLISTGESLTNVREVIDLRIWSPLNQYQILRLESDNNPVSILDLLEPVLGNGTKSGIYTYQDASSLLLTRSLSRFVTPWMLLPQELASDPIRSQRERLTRNRLIYWRQAVPTVIVDLEKRFANQQVQLQLRKYSRGKVFYTTLAKIELDNNADSLFELAKPLKREDRLRLMVSGKPLVFHNVVFI